MTMRETIEELGARIVGLRLQNAELLEALKKAQPWVERERTDMLCKAGAYSERELEFAKKSQHWRKVMAACKAIDAALAKVRP